LYLTDEVTDLSIRVFVEGYSIQEICSSSDMLNKIVEEITEGPVT
jgi:hypothetical protein